MERREGMWGDCKRIGKVWAMEGDIVRGEE